MIEKENLCTIGLFKNMLEVNLSLVNQINSNLTNEEQYAIMYHLIKNLNDTTEGILKSNIFIKS